MADNGAVEGSAVEARAVEARAEVREVTPGGWAVMRDVRLTALRDAPFAFGSSYAREALFTEAQWRARITDRAVTYLAYAATAATTGEPAGLAGVYVEDREAELVSMWVRPSARGQKIGSALIDAAAGWARSQGFPQLWLWVTESNEPARRLYERYGFAYTGDRQPLPSDPSLAEVRMQIPL